MVNTTPPSGGFQRSKPSLYITTATFSPSNVNTHKSGAASTIQDYSKDISDRSKMVIKEGTNSKLVVKLQPV